MSTLTKPKPPHGWRVVKRETGLVELVCEHGVGHPSLRLSPPWRAFDGVHGCDGCCSRSEFTDFEAAS